MEETIDCFENSKSKTIKRLQSEAKLFLTSFKLVLNGIFYLRKSKCITMKKQEILKIHRFIEMNYRKTTRIIFMCIGTV